MVLGVNKYWKQNSNMNHVNNQNFVQIPFATLRNLIRYKAEERGIVVFEQEESYTSRADLLAGDFIPVYGEKGASEQKFSGKRLKRGGYRSFNGTFLNADLNAAGNILRKKLPTAFENFKSVSAYDFLKTILVRRYPELNKRILVKEIGVV